MATSQGGVGAVTALQSHHYSSGPHWSPGVSQYQHQQQPHTARSLDRVLEDAVSSGILNLSGRKLREYPGLSYDLTDTTQAGGSLSPRGSCETTGGSITWNYATDLRSWGQGRRVMNGFFFFKHAGDIISGLFRPPSRPLYTFARTSWL